MSNKLIDLIIKYNELNEKEKKLFTEVIGIQVKEIPVMSSRSLQDILKEKQPEPYKRSLPYERYLPSPNPEPYPTIPIKDPPLRSSYPYYPLDIGLKGDNSP